MVTFKKSAEVTNAETLNDDALIELAEERVRLGLAPPPRIYRVEFRRRINWSKFPAWAQPVDPEVFVGCCHEG